MANEFDPYRVIAALNENRVDYVLIGGFAAAIHGSPHVTFDLDVAPSRNTDNLDRLSKALLDLNAKLETGTGEPPMPFDPAPAILRRTELLNLQTDGGALDIVFAPAGIRGYADLAKHASPVEIGRGLTVVVASLDDVIRSKEAADRPKDRVVLDDLRELRDLIRRDGRSGD